MEWTSSAGGPLICAEKHISAHWMGTKGLSANSVADAKTDYDRACAIAEYLEAIRCDAGNILVLGDEPLQSAFFRTEKGGLVIARWVYAQPDQDVNTILALSLGNIHELAGPVAFEIRRGLLTLFDSALQGSNEIQDHAEASIQSGLYRVTTEKLEQERIFSFLIHRFLKADN